VAFGLQPFLFDKTDNSSSSLIYDEEDDVKLMYFIQEGSVGIGYYVYSQGLSKT
jgi:hypothetical protein